MFAAFEKLVKPYPEGPPPLPPRGFGPFVWACSHGLRRYIALMTLLTAAIGVFEALLFAMLGRIVDWLGPLQPAQLWAQHGTTLLLLAAVLVGSTLLVACQSMFKQQAMAGNFPMRLRWNFHRLLLQQSMNFYQDEFAGRIATKLMQTALAVRDVWMILADILVFVLIYFVTMVAVVGGFDAWLLLPFVAWVLLYIAALRFFVPRLARTAKAQADARSLMTGRITDAYTNIATVKLFSHAGREAGYARSAMQEFLVTVHAQMRLVSGFEIMNHVLGIALILATAGATLWLWTQGQVGVGAVAAATAMSLRLNGISHWVMWEMANLFEQVGTVQDGINTLSRPQTVLDRPGAVPLVVFARRTAVRRRQLPLRRQCRAARHRPADAAGAPGREDRPGRPLRRRQEHPRQPAAALSRRGVGSRADRRPGHRRRHAGQSARADRHGHAGHLAAAPLGARQHPLRPARRH